LDRVANVKIVAALSPELFRRQSEAYRDAVLSHDDWLDSTSITNGAKKLMHDCTLHHVAEEYAMSSDFDDRWRTGGNVAELEKEAHIDPDSLWAGITKFANERTKRLKSLVHPDVRASSAP
jgi:transketolase